VGQTVDCPNAAESRTREWQVGALCGADRLANVLTDPLRQAQENNPDRDQGRASPRKCFVGQRYGEHLLCSLPREFASRDAGTDLLRRILHGLWHTSEQAIGEDRPGARK
jgi:hypothetical protein